MLKLRRLAWLVLLPAVLAMVLVACGGDDDDDSDTGDEETAATEQAEDSGDESATNEDEKDSGSSGGGAAPTSQDERYVTQVCNAMNTFLTTLEEAFLSFDPEKMDEEDPDKFFETFVSGLEDARDQLKAADPPGDVEEWHNLLVQFFDDTIAGVRDSGDMLPDNYDFPNPPVDAQVRLAKAAEQNEACQALEEHGASLFESVQGATGG